jgi:ankyrin repeat protein
LKELIGKRTSAIFYAVIIGLFFTTNLFSQEADLLTKVRANDISAIKELIAAGADIDEENTHEYMAGNTPLFMAASEDNEELIRFLIKNGADVNAKSKKGKTPLSLAVEAGHTKIIELLKANGSK